VRNVPVVDCHALLGTGETWHTPRRRVNYTAEEILSRAEEAGIDQTCIMAPRSSAYDDANRQIARACEKYPDNFLGFAVHRPQREVGRLRVALMESVRSLGLRGVRVDGPPNRELMDAAAELAIPIIFSPDSSGGAGPARSYHMIASYYPTVSLILPHIGSYRTNQWWAHIEAIDLCKRYAKIYLETSGLARLKYLFGSYAPELDPRIEIYGVRLLKLPAEAEARVLGGNFLDLVNHKRK
jgi:predicted TIM-barrel fold metal-dependent hydrolase